MSVANEAHAGGGRRPRASARPPSPSRGSGSSGRSTATASSSCCWRCGRCSGRWSTRSCSPIPSKIAVAFYELTVSGELPYYAMESLEILFCGLFFAIVVGVPLAVLMARVKPVDWALEWPINALYSTPMVALVPLLVLWFGIYMQAKIIVVFLFAVFPILINTYQGVRECDKNMLEVARSFRSPEWKMWQDVLLPFALPYIAAGIRLAIGRGLVGMVIAEFYTTISGLGYMISRYANVFETDKTFVPVILLMFLGITLTSALKWVERRIAPWSRADA